MCILKITDDDDNTTSYSLKDYSILENDNELLLTLNSDDKIIKYAIRSDTREPNLSSIKQFITQQLDCAFSNEEAFVVSEYLQRMYIFIGSDDDRRQFTANRVE
ncbi:hypothetical protein C808_03915 [Lachnospiraceae bacterium M18-1]|nr:hypothetical protein C808_03915 [Lachnospiraceae bacterium M18-1]